MTHELRSALLAIFAATVALPAIICGADAPDAASTNKLTTDFIGFYLGCTQDELQAELKKSSKPMKLIKKTTDNEEVQYVFSGNNKLNGATGTLFMFWRGKLSSISVYFQSEEAGQLYDAIKLKMEKRYGKMTDDIVFAGKKCTLIKEGIAFIIEYENNPVAVDTTLLTARHVGIKAAQAAAEVEKKADDLGNL